MDKNQELRGDMVKKFFALITAGCIALSLVGCGSAHSGQSDATLPRLTDSTRDTPSIPEHPGAPIPMHAIILPTIKETVTGDDGTDLFSLSFQRTQVILHNQEAEDKIIGDLQSRNGSTLDIAYQMEAQARLDYPDNEYWSEYFIEIAYTPTRLDQAVLSLFGNTSSYSGGPHPSLTTDSVTYDLQTGDVVSLDDILTPECSSDTLYQLILDSLESQAEDLYYDYADALGDRFTGELHSIQDWYFSRSGLCFHFAPYDIAPYSSGTVIAELPYSSLAGILNEKYFPTETPLATGSMYAEAYMEDARERFTFIADVPVCDNGIEVLLYPDASVTDLRIETGSRYEESNQYIAVSTVFAANTMNVGDAIRLNANLENSDTVLRLVYHSEGQEYSAFITYDEVSNSIQLTNG